ncbi:MAG: hypothetical protein ABJ358_14600 [Rhizobiaceae bacterium]
MPQTLARFIFIAGLAILALSQPITASAQTITLGGDDQQVVRILRGEGYRNVRITSRGLTIVRTEACKGTDKYQVKVSILGKITSTRKIGTCPAPQANRFTRNDATDLLQKNGYRRIEARREGRIIVATACRNDRRYQIEFNRRGEVAARQRIGECRPEGLNKRQLTNILERNGYRRIEIVDAELPRYVAEACRENDRVSIEMNRRGDIGSERRIGRCRQQIDPANIAKLMRDNGYTRIEVIDRRRPPYIAHGCKNNDRIEVTIGRFGRLRGENRIGSCARPIDPANLVTLMGKEGYNRVKVLRGSRTPYLVEGCKGTALVELLVDRFGRITKEDNVGRCAPPVTKQRLEDRFAKDGYLNVRVRKLSSGWSARVCRDEVERLIRVNSFGDTVSERDSGTCASNSVLNILKTLENRGARSTTIFVEGCYRNKKYRWAYDRLGNRTGRKAIGGC